MYHDKNERSKEHNSEGSVLRPAGRALLNVIQPDGESGIPGGVYSEGYSSQKATGLTLQLYLR